MKKLFAFLAVAVFFFAACGNKATSTEETTTAQDTEQVETQEPVADMESIDEVTPEDSIAEEVAPIEGEVQA